MGHRSAGSRDGPQICRVEGWATDLQVSGSRDEPQICRCPGRGMGRTIEEMVDVMCVGSTDVTT